MQHPPADHTRRARPGRRPLHTPPFPPADKDQAHARRTAPPAAAHKTRVFVRTRRVCAAAAPRGSDAGPSVACAGAGRRRTCSTPRPCGSPSACARGGGKRISASQRKIAKMAKMAEHSENGGEQRRTVFCGAGRAPLRPAPGGRRARPGCAGRRTYGVRDAACPISTG